MTQLFTYLLMDTVPRPCQFFSITTQQNATFWGVRTVGGANDPNSNQGEIFVQCTYPPSFIILCLIVWKLSCWQINPQTNLHHWKHPPCFAMLRRWVKTPVYPLPTFYM